MIPSGADLSLYFVTDTKLCGGLEKVPGVVYEAVMGGVGVVQVRDKHLDDDAFAQLASACARAVAQANQDSGRTARTVVNDRLSIAADLGLDVHVGQSDAAAERARETLGESAMIGLSVSTPEQARAAVDSGHADLVGIGPAWATPTKTDAAKPLGPGGVAECARIARSGGMASVVIGGVNAHTAGSLAGVPADGLCVVSAIASADDPRRAASELLRLSQNTLDRKDLR
ncbi:thiamine phosphate synthase [uncultured Kocuria sp.]|uniref:thiamine phosphate synthase n=1 Tax=uncultured Kocuria sp. TaxID=259305 RepID=UPI00259666D0|nr:thiamine phosphate synthase [uncultured Kocuria sp.]MCT1367063.1 thiamine phosphate synthase [Rothia sp. p3-SID1597]